MTAYIIIAVVLIVIVVPLFSILPSPRQRAQMVMRTAARKVGVSVELKEIDDPNPDQDKYISHIGKQIPARLKVAGYRLQRRRASDWRQLPEASWCFQRNLDGSWREAALGEAVSGELRTFLRASLELMPDDVVQLEEISYNVVVYWSEREPGSEDNVLNFLKKCIELPLHDPVLPDEIDGAD